MNTDQTIDRLIECLTAKGAAIQPIHSCPWIPAWESTAGFTLPPSFRSLVTRFSFTPIELPEFELLGNTGLDDDDEMTVATLQDATLSRVALNAGFLHFARSSNASYDPICFDMRRSREAPIVRLDHEKVLQFSEIAFEPVEDSFLDFAWKMANHQNKS